jgi:hypothetical protein
LQVIEKLKSRPLFRKYSILTTFTLYMSILLSIFGLISVIWIQPIASLTIILGTLLLLFQILIILQSVNRKNKVGWILHRFAYVTLLIMIVSFLSIVGCTYLASLSLFGGNIMTISIMGYVMQASFGICLASITCHFLQIDDAWQEWME